MKPVTIDGVERYLGCLPRQTAIGQHFRVMPSLPRQEWVEVDLSTLVDEILDQDGIGACVAYATVQAIHLQRKVQGLKPIRLSPGHLYGLINRGVDEGALISDAMLAVRQYGVCTVNTIPEREWRQRKWPENWQQEAKKYRVLEVRDCPTFDKIVNALVQGFVVVYGIAIGSNFVPNDKGIIPSRRGFLGGHALLACGLKQFGTKWYVLTLNSWGPNWGLNGFCYVPESYFDGTFNDGFAVRSVVQTQGEEEFMNKTTKAKRQKLTKGTTKKTPQK